MIVRYCRFYSVHVAFSAPQLYAAVLVTTMARLGSWKVMLLRCWRQSSYNSVHTSALTHLPRNFHPRYAGRAYPPSAPPPHKQLPALTLHVKGVKSTWRQAAPYIADTLDRVLHHLLMEDDVGKALEYAKGRIRGLLTGECWLGELVMTGGLWRVTGS